MELLSDGHFLTGCKIHFSTSEKGVSVAFHAGSPGIVVAFPGA